MCTWDRNVWDTFLCFDFEALIPKSQEFYLAHTIPIEPIGIDFNRKIRWTSNEKKWLSWKEKSWILSFCSLHPIWGTLGQKWMFRTRCFLAKFDIFDGKRLQPWAKYFLGNSLTYALHSKSLQSFSQIDCRI